MTTSEGQAESWSRISKAKAGFTPKGAIVTLFPGEEVEVEFSGRAGEDQHLMGWTPDNGETFIVERWEAYCVFYAASTGGETYEISRMIEWRIRVPTEQWQSLESWAADFTFSRLPFGDITT